MTIDNFAPPREDRPEYDFTGAAPGTSIWVETNNQRIALYSAFNRWKEATGSKIAGKTMRVGASDPRGEGYRLVFSSPVIQLRPMVLARLPRFEGLNFMQVHRLNWTGLQTNEDVIAAAMSCEPIPTTVTEANAIARLIWAGNTPKQIEHCLKTHGETLAQTQANNTKRERERAEATQKRRAMYQVTDEMRREQAENMRSEGFDPDED